MTIRAEGFDASSARNGALAAIARTVKYTPAGNR
jgi:hypothetical protein